VARPLVDAEVAELGAFHDDAIVGGRDPQALAAQHLDAVADHDDPAFAVEVAQQFERSIDRGRVVGGGGAADRRQQRLHALADRRFGQRAPRRRGRDAAGRQALAVLAGVDRGTEGLCVEHQQRVVAADLEPLLRHGQHEAPVQVRFVVVVAGERREHADALHEAWDRLRRGRILLRARGVECGQQAGGRQQGCAPHRSPPPRLGAGASCTARRRGARSVIVG
jgi:hypothetical protein